MLKILIASDRRSRWSLVSPVLYHVFRRYRALSSSPQPVTVRLNVASERLS